MIRGNDKADIPQYYGFEMEAVHYNNAYNYIDTWLLEEQYISFHWMIQFWTNHNLKPCSVTYLQQILSSFMLVWFDHSGNSNLISSSLWFSVWLELWLGLYCIWYISSLVIYLNFSGSAWYSYDIVLFFSFEFYLMIVVFLFSSSSKSHFSLSIFIGLTAKPTTLLSWNSFFALQANRPMEAYYDKNLICGPM